MTQKIWNKKQVMHIRNLLKVNEDKRPIFSRIHIDTEGYIEFTDSYQAHRSKEPIMAAHEVSRFIHLDDLIVWYKLASTRDYITVDTINEIAKDTDGMVYPNLERLMNNDTCAIEKIALNVKNLTTFMNIVGDEALRMEFTGEMRQVKSYNKLFKSVLLPVRVFD